MADMMTFPDTMEEFMEQYKIVDTDGIYMSKGAELVPIFRMKQWFEHLPSAQPEIIYCRDCRHRNTEHIENHERNFWCNHFEITITEEDFCSDAERRENG